MTIEYKRKTEHKIILFPNTHQIQNNLFHTNKKCGNNVFLVLTTPISLSHSHTHTHTHTHKY